MSQKSFRLLNLNIFRSTKSTKVDEVFSETYEHSYYLRLLPLNFCKYKIIRGASKKVTIFRLFDSCKATNLSFPKFLQLAKSKRRVASDWAGSLAQVGFNVWPVIHVKEPGSAVWNICTMYLDQWIFRNKLHVFQIWALGLGLIPTSLVSGSSYQLVCNSMEAHDLPSPVLVARFVEYRIEMHDFDPDS